MGDWGYLCYITCPGFSHARVGHPDSGMHLSVQSPFSGGFIAWHAWNYLFPLRPPPPPPNKKKKTQTLFCLPIILPFLFPLFFFHHHCFVYPSSCRFSSHCFFPSPLFCLPSILPFLFPFFSITTVLLPIILPFLFPLFFLTHLCLFLECWVVISVFPPTVLCHLKKKLPSWNKCPAVSLPTFFSSLFFLTHYFITRVRNNCFSARSFANIS